MGWLGCQILGGHGMFDIKAKSAFNGRCHLSPIPARFSLSSFLGFIYRANLNTPEVRPIFSPMGSITKLLSPRKPQENSRIQKGCLFLRQGKVKGISPGFLRYSSIQAKPYFFN
jgi:hypothetical protein